MGRDDYHAQPQKKGKMNSSCRQGFENDDFANLKGVHKREKNNKNYLAESDDDLIDIEQTDDNGEEEESELYCGDCIFFESYHCFFRDKVDEDSDPVAIGCEKYED